MNYLTIDSPPPRIRDSVAVLLIIAFLLGIAAGAVGVALTVPLLAPEPRVTVVPECCVPPPTHSSLTGKKR